MTELFDYDPTEDQVEALSIIDAFTHDKSRQSLVINGAAGTGKTTLIAMIRKRLLLQSVIAAPTNKAVGVLRSKGFKDATTIDRVLNLSRYAPIMRPPTPDEIAHYTENGLPIPAAIMEEAYEKIPLDTGGTVVIVDESSMTSANDFDRLIALYEKVIFVGDGFQLPPVEGQPWFQTAEPDVTLQQIVRTASTSEITQLANMVRRRSPEWKKHSWQNEVTILHRSDPALDEALKSADIVLAHKNATCDLMNYTLRDLRGLQPNDDPTRPAIGDRLLSWQTNKTYDVVKSEIYDVTSSSPFPAGYFVRLSRDGCAIPICKVTLQQQKSEIVVAKLLRFSYAHCITCHKSQGSEWDKVVVLAHDHAVKFDDHWNWLYTACTRAKKHLTIIT